MVKGGSRFDVKEVFRIAGLDYSINEAVGHQKGEHLACIEGMDQEQECVSALDGFNEYNDNYIRVGTKVSMELEFKSLC